MPFLRFSRDKRGVESFALVHSTTNRRGKVRPRVLYWFRSPPDIKVGREPFDPEIRRALEKQYPEIPFDWRAIAETPIPSADADKWRERRRAERAATHAARAEESADAEGADAGDAETTEPAAAPNGEAGAAADADRAGDISTLASEPMPNSASEPAVSAAPPASGAPRTGDPTRKRRRRRSGRGGNPPGTGRPASTPPSGGGEPSGD